MSEACLCGEGVLGAGSEETALPALSADILRIAAPGLPRWPGSDSSWQRAARSAETETLGGRAGCRKGLCPPGPRWATHIPVQVAPYHYPAIVSGGQVLHFVALTALRCPLPDSYSYSVRQYTSRGLTFHRQFPIRGLPSYPKKQALNLPFLAQVFRRPAQSAPAGKMGVSSGGFLQS